MSLWGCNCPLPALAACHQRGMVCSQLVLFCPLFCEQAWQCLRAFRVVAILQSGLLAQVSSLRLPLGHSGPVLTMQPVPSCPAPACSGGYRRLCCFSAGSYRWAHNLWVLIIYLFFLPVMLPSDVPRLATVRLFPGVWKLLSFRRLPSRDRSPSLPLLSLFLSFIFFPTSF